MELGERGGFDRTDAVSFGAWVFPTSNEAMAILSKIDDPQAYRGFDLLLEGGKPAVHLVHHWPDNGLKVIAQKAVALDAWHHVLVTWDGSGKAAGVSIYVDGQPQELDINNDNLSETIKTDQPLRIGRRSASNSYRGLIDDVQFFSARLSADDARRLADRDRSRRDWVRSWRSPGPKDERTAAKNCGGIISMRSTSATEQATVELAETIRRIKNSTNRFPARW